MPFAGWRIAMALVAAACTSAAPVVQLTDTGAPPERVVLTPGQFLWYVNLETAQPGVVSVVVSIPSQLAYVYRDGALIGVSTVSTGRPGKETPLGSFTVLEKQLFHRSNKYSNAPMPFMQRLTWDGIAMHGGQLPGYPASHGCIRLPAEFASQLFELTRLGALVTVTDQELLEPSYNPFVTPRIVVPKLTADVRDLGGEAFNVVTMRDASAEVETPGPAPAEPPVKFGPRKPIVQPIPRGG
jgi:lipoprotein-anchoring transpeptidase ErfK/SrfK